jgi:hypothetical protein
VPYGTSANEKDVPIVIAENYSIAYWSWIALRGPVEIDLDEVLRGGGGTKRWGCCEEGLGKKEDESEGRRVETRTGGWGVRLGDY